MSDHVSVRLGLLDKQIVDCDRRAIGRVDDLELAVEDGAVAVEAILTGAEALGERLGGLLGGWMAGVAARLRPRERAEGPARIDPALVAGLEPSVRLRARLDELPELAGLEHWLARNLIGRIPGAGDAGE